MTIVIVIEYDKKHVEKIHEIAEELGLEIEFIKTIQDEEWALTTFAHYRVTDNQNRWNSGYEMDRFILDTLWNKIVR